MIVISDTSVISNLIQIDRLRILKELYTEIIIPESVKNEVERLRDFGVDLEEFSTADWIFINNPINQQLEAELLESLDKGESAAIALAHELQADYLAIDERAGRRMAKSLGIKIIGLIGILIQAKEADIIEKVTPFLDQLISEANFYISEQFYEQIVYDLKE